MLNLYALSVDFGRMGTIDGLFVCTMDELCDAYGKRIYLGEALGKHSEIWFDLEPEMIEFILDDQEAISKIVEKTSKSVSGYNPLYYIEDAEDE